MIATTTNAHVTTETKPLPQLPGAPASPPTPAKYFHYHFIMAIFVVMAFSNFGGSNGRQIEPYDHGYFVSEWDWELNLSSSNTVKHSNKKTQQKSAPSCPQIFKTVIFVIMAVSKRDRSNGQ